MKSLFNIIFISVIALTLAACKTILPAPTSPSSTLILAPYFADNTIKSQGAWAYAYILNNNENLLIKINPRNANDSFTVTEGLSEGEYSITGIKTYPINGGRTQAIGKDSVVQIKKNEQITFNVKAGKITILPIKITISMQSSPDRETLYAQHFFNILSKDELTELKKETSKLDGFEPWSINF